MTTINKIKIEVNGNIPFNFAEDPETGFWIGACEPLSITVQASNKSELFQEFLGAMESLFLHLLQTNELHSFLESKGWRTGASLPKLNKKAKVDFDIPFNASQVEARDLELATC